MDSIDDLLQKRAPQTPDDLVAIKEYIANKFNFDVRVSKSTHGYGIVVHSAAQATYLRMDSPNILRSAGASVNKKLFIRIEP